jgi:hypothetical protein
MKAETAHVKGETVKVVLQYNVDLFHEVDKLYTFHRFRLLPQI